MWTQGEWRSVSLEEAHYRKLEIFDNFYRVDYDLPRLLT